MTCHKDSGRGQTERACRVCALVLAALFLCLAGPSPQPAFAGDRSQSGDISSPRAALERELAGLYAVPGYMQEFGQPQDEIGASDDFHDEDDQGGSSNLGDKIKAGALSAVLPGAGQYFNGNHQKAYIFAGAEVAVWTAYFVFDSQADKRMSTSREYGLIYAGVSGEHSSDFWQNVGRYMSSEEYYDALAREARALEEDIPPPLTGDDTWLWVNNDRRREYLMVRADANRAYDRRDFTILFAVVNRAISVVDAVLGVGDDDQPGVATGILGMNLAVDVNPAGSDPGGRCLLTRSF